MSVRILSSEELEVKLLQLRCALSTLPASVPYSNQCYNFTVFGLFEEDIEDYGRQGAVNHILEVTFCPNGRKNEPIQLKERGPGLEAVVDVLAQYTSEFPTDTVLQKWIDDLLEAAIRTGGSVCTTAHNINYK